MNWFGFIKKGKHVDSKGRPFDATDETLNKILEMNKGKQIPIAIGHPATDSPAWGWVNDLKRVGDELLAMPKELVTEFEAMLKKGMFKTVSVALNQDLTIRHIGFLGATPPAIDGLTQFKFSATADDAGMVFEFAASAKPAEYAHIPDSEFMDPKNFKYPIDQAHIHAAMSYWAMPKNREGYSAEEIKTMTGRMMAAAKKYGIAVDESKWQFSNENSKKEEHAMKKLFAKLGLTETATEDDAISAVEKIAASANAIVANKAVLGALELKPEATEAEVVGLISTFKQSHTAVIDLRKDNAKLEKEIGDRDAEEVVRFARSKGKITREQEPWALEYAKSDLDGFRNFINKAPVVLDPEFTDKGGATFVSPGSDVDMDTVQSIASKALEFQAAAEKNGRVVTISEAVGAVIKKKR